MVTFLEIGTRNGIKGHGMVILREKGHGMVGCTGAGHGLVISVKIGTRIGQQQKRDTDWPRGTRFGRVPFGFHSVKG